MRLLVEDRRLWFLPPTGALEKEPGPAETIWVPLPFVVGAATDLQAEITDILTKIGKVANLTRIASHTAASGKMGRIGVHITVTRSSGETEVIDPDEVRTLKPGDAIKLAVTNAGFDNLDVTALFVDGRLGVVAVAAERLHRSKGPQEIVRGDIDQTSFGLERIVLIMVASDPGAERADFSFLAQPPVRLRGRTTRGGGGPGTLETLLRDAGFGRTATTRGFAKASDSALSKTRFAVFAWWTIPAK